MVLHALDQGVDGLQAEAVVLAPAQGVGLVDEQHASQGGLHSLLGEGRGVAHVLAHQIRPGDLHQLAAPQHSNGLQIPGDDPGHGGFAGARVPGEDHVHGRGVGLQALLLAHLLDLEVVLQGEDVVLHRLQPHNLGQLLLHFRQGLVAHRLLGFQGQGLALLRRDGGQGPALLPFAKGTLRTGQLPPKL